MRAVTALAAGVWLVVLLQTAGSDVAWPVNGGVDNIRYSSLTRSTRQRQPPAGRVDVRHARRVQGLGDAEQSDRRRRRALRDDAEAAVVALDAATGASSGSSIRTAARRRRRDSGIAASTVYKDRVFFTYRNFLYALDKKTGKPIPSFGTDGRIDLREGLGPPAQGLSVSASTPGSIFEDMLIIGSTVPETLPGSPGHIRAYDVKTGKLRWIFHTIPHPGEFGYDTWPPDAYKLTGGANAWAGVTVDAKLGMVFAATGSASFDFYGATRARRQSVRQLRARARRAHRQAHLAFPGRAARLWDWDFPAAPSLVTVTRDGRPVDAVAQITKTGYVYVFDARHRQAALSDRDRNVPASTLDGERSRRRSRIRRCRRRSRDSV